ncbi:hypothetical protein [Aeribacillus pallidus]
MRITDKIPSDWRDLEYKVADILNEARYNTVVNKEIETVRGNVH